MRVQRERYIYRAIYYRDIYLLKKKKKFNSKLSYSRTRLYLVREEF